MKRLLFKGSGVALITPFTDDGVNIPALKRLIDFHLQNGTDALIVCGTTGEPSTMTQLEQEQVIDAAVQHAAGRIPIVAGTGGNCTRSVIEAARRARALGADAQLCVTPYYNKATQAGLIAHYQAILEDGSLPVILYNVPSRTNLDIAPDTLARLAEHPQLLGIKEASADVARIITKVRLCEGRLAFYSGSDELLLPLLALGFDGVISVTGNILPRQMHELVAMFHSGDLAGARALQFRLDAMHSAMFSEVNPIPVKTAANLMGLEAGPLRLPLTPMGEGAKANLIEQMKAWSLIK